MRVLAEEGVELDVWSPTAACSAPPASPSASSLRARCPGGSRRIPVEGGAWGIAVLAAYLACRGGRPRRLPRDPVRGCRAWTSSSLSRPISAGSRPSWSATRRAWPSSGPRKSGSTRTHPAPSSPVAGRRPSSNPTEDDTMDSDSHPTMPSGPEPPAPRCPPRPWPDRAPGVDHLAGYLAARCGLGRGPPPTMPKRFWRQRCRPA